MKAFSLFVFFFFSLCGTADTVTVYTYDSLVGKHNLGEVLSQEFEKTGNKIHWVPFSSAGEALNQIKLEKEKPIADLILGIDNTLLSQAKESGFFEALTGTASRGISADCLLDADLQFVPFDYGFLAFVYQEEKTKTLPKSLKEMTGIEYRKKIALEDPRTSSLGLSFLAWTQLVFPKESDRKEFWKTFNRSVLSYSPSWSGAYGLFLKGEAPFVLSYTTSPAYHLEKEKNTSFKSVLFPEGHYRQVEFAAHLKSSPKKELSRKFLQLLLSPAVQEKIPTTQWMYPVLSGTKLPESFKKLPSPKAIKQWAPSEQDKRKLVSDWSLTVVKAQ